jgi:hypothetical protein
MKQHYENCGHKLPGGGEEAKFSEFLEYFSYLGPEELTERRRQVIEQYRT